jgi:hypothetical protein
VPGQPKRDRKLEKSVLRPYFDFKTRLDQNSGFAYSIDFFPIIQAATGGANTSFETSGVFMAYFYFALFGSGTSHTGSLVFKVENRHGLGTDMLADGLGTTIDYPGYVADP